LEKQQGARVWIHTVTDCPRPKLLTRYWGIKVFGYMVYTGIFLCDILPIYIDKVKDVTAIIFIVKGISLSSQIMKIFRQISLNAGHVEYELSLIG
jgi:hypothetical protein